MTENSTTGVDEAVLSFPVERDARCPFDVPAALIDSAAHQPLRRARIWDAAHRGWSRATPNCGCWHWIHASAPTIV